MFFLKTTGRINTRIHSKIKECLISKKIKDKIFKDVISLESFGMNDLTWKKEEAIKLLTALDNEAIGILGGSVYKIDKNTIIPLYDNWSCEPNEIDTPESFYQESKKRAFDYINKYPIYPGEYIVFSLVFSEDI